MKSLHIARVLLLVFFLLPFAVTAQVIERVSVSSGGAQGDGESRLSSARWQVSDDGRYVVFESDASNLVADDANGVTDVFVRDLELRTTTRVSVSTDGSEADGPSTFPVISGGGRYVAFNSAATNLVEGDTNAARDIFVRDLLTGQTTRINLSVDGGEADEGSSTPSLNYDGRSVAFASSATNLVAETGNGVADVFIRSLLTGDTERVSVAIGGGGGNLNSWGPSMSASGRQVCFLSVADNLDEGDTNGFRNIFVRDLDLGQTVRVNVDPTGGNSNGQSSGQSMTADGRVVAFSSSATNLIAGDTNGLHDIFVRDLDTHTTTRVNVSDGGTQTGIGGSWAPSMNSDGRYVTYESDDENLVAGDSNGFSDIFSHDRQTGRTARLSVPVSGGQGNDFSRRSTVSGDGRYVAFESAASNLVPGDTNDFMDIFVAVGPAAIGDVVRIIPGAASASGVGDAYFITDVRLFNPDTDSSITVFLSFLEREADNSRAAETPVEIAPRRGEALNDVLSTVFGLSQATGAIRMRSDSVFFATSRTYNVGGEAGTFGSYIPSMNANEALTQGILLQVANNPAEMGFRSNIGFANPGLTHVNVKVKVFNADTGELVGERNLKLLPRSFSQKNAFQFVGQKNLFVMNGTVEFAADYPVLAYTTVIDNTSDDPTCVLPYADQGTPP